jgi:hypothetical protein
MEGRGLDRDLFLSAGAMWQDYECTLYEAMKTAVAIVLHLIVLVILSLPPASPARAEAVLKNPGISESESLEFSDWIDSEGRYVVARVNISVQKENNRKTYLVKVAEGDVYVNTLQLDYAHLTTIAEDRYHNRSGELIESYHNDGKGRVHFFNQIQGINKHFANHDDNIYSRFACFLSFSGFPFEVGKTVFFSSYIAEYGDALPMKLRCVAKEAVTVQGGTFNCYKLELTVAGWQSLFSAEKFYFYYEVDPPHRFVKYEEQHENGEWYANELIRIVK